MSEVQLVNVRKVYGATVAVDNVSLRIRESEFVTLLGASGSGKTTCLRMVAGFVAPSAGQVIIGNEDVTRLPPHKRNTAMVFQHYALFPHLTVLDNIGFGLSVRRVAKTEVRQRAEEALDLVQLRGLGSRYPNQLSGGQRQRVALARAVILRPQILLLDEPLGALDLKLREGLQTEIKRVQSALGITTLFVTHDQGEALSMSDRVAVMRDGQIIQMDTPTKLYDAPASSYVARFVGRITMIPAKVTEATPEHVKAQSSGGNNFISRFMSRPVSPGENVNIAVRPECYRIGHNAANKIDAVVEHASYQGASWTLTCRDSDGISHIVDLPWGLSVPKVHDRIPLSWAKNACRVFPESQKGR